MHELSLAQSIVEVASEAAQIANAGRVIAVQLRLGALAGVVKSALLFSWDIATEDTPIAGARLEIEELPVIVYCPACEQQITLPNTQKFRCPTCGTPTPQLIQGREFEVKALEIEDDRTPT